MSLISREELKRTFCVTKYYGENDLRWPQSTTCLVKCEVSNSFPPGKCITGTDEDIDDWERFNNTLGETKVHAETNMTIFVNEKVKKYVGVKYVDICIYINYSPCYKCAEVIKDMMDKFKENDIVVEIKIFLQISINVTETQQKMNLTAQVSSI